MTLYLFLIVFLIVLGIAAGMMGGFAIYQRQSAAHQHTLENLQRLTAQLLDDVRFEGTAQLRRTNAGRELLLLLEKNGELALLETEWSDFNYRTKKRMNACRKEIESRSKHVSSRNLRAKSIAGR
jgi:hypothetical protein